MLKIGQLVVDESKLSDDELGVLEQFVENGVLTDDVLSLLVKVGGGEKSKESEGETKSSKIRRMSAAGMSIGDISRTLDLRFQFVYNVVSKEKMKKAAGK